VIDLASMTSNPGRSTLERFIAHVHGLDLPPTVVAGNKVDLLADRTAALDTLEVYLRSQIGVVRGVVGVSAATGEGVENIRQILLENTAAAETTAHREAVLMTTRQRSAITDALSSLRHLADLAKGISETIDSADLLAFELREALDHLGAVTGAVTTEDLLGQVFANFCIGK
jgi:tRNA modification GTPase